jgi:hypothetical protein
MGSRKKSYDERELQIQPLWAEFNRLYPDDGACLRALCGDDDSSFGGHACRFCGVVFKDLDYVMRFYKCPECKNTVWLTADTLFRKTRNPRAWLAAIWFMEHGLVLSSSRFHSLLEIAQSTAWRILRSVSTVIQDKLIGNGEHLSSAVFVDLFCRRSCESPRREHPSAEQAASEADARSASESADRDTVSTDKDSVSTEQAAAATGKSEAYLVEVWGAPVDPAKETSSSDSGFRQLADVVLAVLSREPKHFDSICAELGLAPARLSSIMMFLELDGQIEVLPGNFFVRHFIGHVTLLSDADLASAGAALGRGASAMAIAEGIQKFRDFIALNFHGIARKYLQNYLASYWTQISNRWANGALLRACRHNIDAAFKLSVKYVSPLIVDMPMVEYLLLGERQ